MKRILITILLSTFTLTNFAQCKYLRNEVDEFTGDTVKMTKLTQFVYSMGSRGNLFFGKLNQTYFLRFEFHESGAKSLMISEGNEMMIKFENNEVLILPALGTELTETSRTYNNNTMSHGSANYSITKEQLELFQKHNAVKARITFESEARDFKVRPADQKRVKLRANCI